VYRNGDAVERYVRSLCVEIENFQRRLQPNEASNIHLRIDTIYLGGGTPSLLTPKQVEQILDSVHSIFSVDPDSEITMEMNPATVSAESLAAYRELGVNRASFGVQTFDDTALRMLARGHDANDARETFRLLRDAGFENISFDLIAGLPRQTLDGWERNLDEALAMQPEHLSLYLLEVHQSTPLAEQIRSKRQPLPDEELAAKMYETMLDRVTEAGYEQYEISNFSLPGFESRHNTKYWRLEPVYGFGVSAHSFDGNQRYSNERDTAGYVSMMENDGIAEVMRETVDAASEFMFLGLRLNRGVDVAEFQGRFGVDISAEYNGELTRLESIGLVNAQKGRLRLTRKGMLFSNEVFEIFV
jgi:oxygen-independent coproporphyrinogen-3 oxidase